MSELKVNKITSENSGPIVAGNIIKCDVAARDDNDLVNLGLLRNTVGSGVGVGQAYVDGQDQFYATQAGRNFVYKSGNVNETVTGIKTFSVTPRTPDSPDQGQDITNKAYVDSRDTATLISANQYTDSKVGGPGAIGFDGVEVDGWTSVDASGITEDQQLDPDWSPILSFTGANGIIVIGSTGTQVKTNFETGLTFSETYNRITIDGAGIGSLGVNQTWQDFTSGRTSGGVYTNSTGKPIMVSVATTSTSNIKIRVGGVLIVQHNTENSGPFNHSYVVPNGATHGLFDLQGGATISQWSELR